jgi:hypothetical protein
MGRSPVQQSYCSGLIAVLNRAGSKQLQIHQKTSKKLLISCFLWNRSMSFMDLFQRNFVFWAIMTSFRKNNIQCLFLNSIFTIF